MSPSSEPPTRLTPRQRLALLILAATALVAVSVVATWFTYRWLQGDLDVHTLGEASRTCEHRIERYFGPRLVLRYFDGHSSHYRPERSDFVVFYKVDAYSSRARGQVHVHLVKCIVTDIFGVVSQFEVYDHGPAPSA